MADHPVDRARDEVLSAAVVDAAAGAGLVTAAAAFTGGALRLVPLLVVAALAGVAVYGLLRDPSPATVTNASFALVHIAVLTTGLRYALLPGGGTR